MVGADFRVEQQEGGLRRIVLTGRWSLRAAGNDFAELSEQLALYFSDPFTQWDLREVEQLDSAAAAMLLSGWCGHWQERATVLPEQVALLTSLAIPAGGVDEVRDALAPVVRLGNLVQIFLGHLYDFLRMFGGLLLEMLRLLRHPKEIPWREISANVYKGGVQALPVTALVGFMIGIAMSYLMALQLRKFGADIFIVNILGLAVIRELGPMLMAVLVAGRSGSAMTAQIGVMRVTEEIDALAAMGISRMLRLILPKVIGLTLVAPLLVFWTSLWALIGGMMAANLQLGIGYEFFLQQLPKVVRAVNITLGLSKGLVFGFLITLVACHYGLRVKPNTESLSASTTSSVVTAITCVILVDAIFAIMSRGVGL